MMPSPPFLSIQHLVTLTLTLGVTLAKVGFIKDQAMNAVFPGPVYSQAPSLPVGHMRPLGWQRKPDGPIPEVDVMPATQEFYEHYVSKKKPAVFRNVRVKGPSFRVWEEDTFLADRHGHLNVTVIVKVARRRDKIVTSERVMELKKFLLDYMYDEWYIASTIPRDMMKDLPLPACVRCGSVGERLLSAQLWISSGGTSSLAHSHDNHLLHCVMFGRRDFILVEQQHRRAFDFEEDFPGSLGGHSYMNTEMVNAFKFKAILRTPWSWSTLYPGDCVFVPAGYIHQVRSYGRSLSITVEFAPMKSFDNSGCTLTEPQYVPLSEAFFLLTFENGRLRLAEPSVTSLEVRSLLDALMGEGDDLSLQKFVHFYDQIVHKTDKLPDGRAIFSMLTPGPADNHVTRNGLESLPDEALENVARVLNSATDIVRRTAARDEHGDDQNEWRHEEL